MRKLVAEGKCELLTIERAKELKGKKIRTIYFGYDYQDDVDEFVVGEVVSNLEFARQNTEGYPDNQGNKNQREYWESFMSASQLQFYADRLMLLRDDKTDTYMRVDSKDGDIFWCSDEDRYVYYIEVSE